MNNDKNSFESFKQKFNEIEKEKKETLSEYTREKEELFKIVRSDFLVGGILASSLFLIINSLILYIGILFPYNLLIGIGLLGLSLVILIKPIFIPKYIIRNYNLKELNILNDYFSQFFEGVNASTIFI